MNIVLPKTAQGMLDLHNELLTLSATSEVAASKVKWLWANMASLKASVATTGDAASGASVGIASAGAAFGSCGMSASSCGGATSACGASMNSCGASASACGDSIKEMATWVEYATVRYEH